MANLYDKYLPKTLREAYVANRDDPKRMELYDEMGVLRALLAQYLEQMKDTEEKIDFDHIDAVTKLVDKISKVQTSISQHEDKLHNTIPVKMIPIIIQAITGIIRSSVGDERIVRMIAERIAGIQLLEHKQIKAEVSDG